VGLLPLAADAAGAACEARGGTLAEPIGPGDFGRAANSNKVSCPLGFSMVPSLFFTFLPLASRTTALLRTPLISGAAKL
jgi:hypothetical protein